MGIDSAQSAGLWTWWGDSGPVECKWPLLGEEAPRKGTVLRKGKEGQLALRGKP